MSGVGWEERMAEKHRPPEPEPRKPPETLAEFLTLVLDQEQRMAEEAEAVMVARGDYNIGWAVSDASMLFFLRHGPRQALRAVDAHRSIVEQWEMTQPPVSGDDDVLGAELGLVLASLASIYSSHPDYRAEWAL